MQLTAELFEQITGLEERALERLAAGEKVDKRSSPRLPLAFKTTACRVDGSRIDPPIVVQVCDISLGGIGLSHSADHKLGKTFVIALKARRNGTPVAIHCMVTGFQPAGHNRVRIGARFVSLGSDSDLARCTAPAGVPAVKPAVPRPAAGPVPRTNPVARRAPLTQPQPTVCDPEEIKRIRNAVLS